MRQIISFRHIEALRAVFLAGSVTGAGERLNITQSAVSHLIRDAENRLGFQLFNRQLGRLAPTHKGELLWGQIQKSFTAFEAVNEFSVRLRSAETRDIVIASAPLISTAILPWAIQRFREAVAENFFTIWPQNTETGIASVRFLNVDIAFGVNLEPVPGVASTVIGSYDLLCFLPPKHPLSKKKLVTPEDLADLPLISLSKIEGIDQSVEAAMPHSDHCAKAVVESPSAITAAALVQAGVGYTLLDPVTAHIYRHSGVAIRAFAPKISYTLRAYWPDTEEPHFDRGRFTELVKERAAEITSGR